jgi:spore coat-associated protein N
VGRVLIVAALLVALVAAVAPERERPPSPVVELASGTLSQSNSRNGVAILTAAGLTPGDSRAGEVTIANTGDLEGAFMLSKSGLSDAPGGGGGVLSSVLELLVEDVTGSPTTVYSGKLAAMGSLSLGDWGPGTARTYRFTVSFPDGGAPPSETSGDNAYKGSALTVQYDWTASGDETPHGRAAGGGIGSAGSGGSGSGGPAPARDTTPPKLTLSGKKGQRLLRRRRLDVVARCDEACRVTASVKAATAAKRRSFPSWRGQLKAGAGAKLSFRLSKKALAAARKILTRRKRVTLSVTARAVDRAGNAASRRLRLPVKR